MGGYALVMFDNDQTLVDAIRISAKAVVKVFWESYGVDCTLKEAYEGGMTVKEMLRNGCKKKGVTKEECESKLEEAAQNFQKTLIEYSHKDKSVTALAGANALLVELRKRNAKIVVVTGNPAGAAKATLHTTGLDVLVDFVIGGDFSSSKAECIREAIGRAKADWGIPRRIVYVGDSVKEAAVCETAGILFFGVATGFDSKDALKKAGANAVFADLRETMKILRELLG